MTVQYIDPRVIATIPAFNDRELINLDGLALDILKNGQETPGEVISISRFREIAESTPWLGAMAATSVPDSALFVMLAGHRRLAAILRGVTANILPPAMEYAACVMDDVVLTAKDMRRRNVRENATREDLTSQEKARKATNMHVVEGISFEEIAEFFGRPNAAGLAWAKACPQLIGLGALAQVAFDRGDIQFNAALQLAKLPEREQNATVTKGITTVAGIKEVVKAEKEGREPRVQGSSSVKPKQTKQVLDMIEKTLDNNKKLSKTFRHRILKSFQLYLRSNTFAQWNEELGKIHAADLEDVPLVLRGASEEENSENVNTEVATA